MKGKEVKGLSPNGYGRNIFVHVMCWQRVLRLNRATLAAPATKSLCSCLSQNKIHNKDPIRGKSETQRNKTKQNKQLGYEIRADDGCCLQ